VSGYTNTVFEELYSSFGAATTTTPTAGAVSLTAGLPAIVVPGGYMNKLGAESSSLKIWFGGQMTATATVPTWLIGLAITSAVPPVFSATAPLGATATFTPTAGTGAYWRAEFDIGLRAIGLGAASTVVTVGKTEGALFPSPFWQSVPATNVAPTIATWETDLQYFLWPYLTLGAATAGNTASVHFCKMYGEN
jgi:hypothetical protein